MFQVVTADLHAQYAGFGSILEEGRAIEGKRATS